MVSHPDPLIESSSLTSITPIPLVYFPHDDLVNRVIQPRLLSGSQLETVLRASQRHEQRLYTGERMGFFLGDGAGVGKGRQLAGIILENWSRGRHRHVWLSASRDLERDARRDLDDIGCTDILSRW